MERLLSQEDPPIGVNDRVPMHERIVRAHLAKALDGDMPAVKELYDRVDGKVKDTHELTGKDGKDLIPPESVNKLELARWIAHELRKAGASQGSS